MVEPAAGPVGEPPEGLLEVPAPTAADFKRLRNTYADAQDRWKIDSQTMKGYYLHSESGYLYVWDQPSGILHEFLPSVGQCQAVWSSAMPQLNAEIWTVLPLPPTDPASLQQSSIASGVGYNSDVYMELFVAHVGGRQVPADVVEPAVSEFCERLDLPPQARKRLKDLPVAGQGYAMQNFQCELDQPSKALTGYIDRLLSMNPPPWGNAACMLRVEATGAILGSSCPDLAALCCDDPPDRLAVAHCKIVSEEDRFFICDLGTSKEGTGLDGFAVGEKWVGPLKTGSIISVGPLRIQFRLSQFASAEPLNLDRKRKLEEMAAEGGCPAVGMGGPNPNAWMRKVFQRTDEDKEERRQRQDMYKDRAQARRERSGGPAGSVAFDGLMEKYQKVKQAEKEAEEVEEARVEEPTKVDHFEAGMNRDGTFLGYGDSGRAGIGFRSEASAELIPNVLDPKALSARDAALLKAQMRYQQTR